MSGMSVLGDITPTPPEGLSEGAAEAGRRKSPNAFRTISEVAEDLHIPQHVLRFWETKFPQLKPLKRGGGRRYYRPEDITLLRRIGDLLYTQGYTIKGVQRLLKEGGIEGVEAAAEADAEGDDAPPAPPVSEAVELRDCLSELESIAAALRELMAR